MERLAYRSNPQKQLLENMSHELRTPLAIIDSYAHLLKRWAGSTPQLREEAIDAILKESQHLQSTTEHFLHLFSPHETYMEWKLFDLVPLLVSVVNDLQTTFKRNIHIERFGDTLATCVIEGDATKIKHLIVIILDNALKYSHQPIHVKLTVMTTYILIQVTDHGIGVDPTDVLYVFDRFYRSKRAIAHHRQGVGLGLAIADQIVRLHQGAISISSEPHIRTTVTVKLPYQHRKSQ
jgi:two-component system sensor histidine kinase ArlS